jgi:hypothetical protein
MRAEVVMNRIPTLTNPSTLWAALALLALGVGGCVVQVSSSCADGILDGNESDIDCGGSCGRCGFGAACDFNTDCASNICSGGRCANVVAGTCADHAKDGDESDVDCGGSCSPCADGRICVDARDCASAACSSQNICLSAEDACFDQVQDSSETDVDCGGICAPCGHLTGSPLPNTVPSIANLYHITSGSALIVTPGSPSYAIIGSSGGSYRLLWTGDTSGPQHVFYGSVWTAGTFSSVTLGCPNQSGPMSCPDQTDDRISLPYNITGGQRVDFDSFNGNNEINGFDFVVAGNNAEPIVVDLYIEGVSDPSSEIFFVEFNTPTQTSNPQSFPFGLTTVP